MNWKDQVDAWNNNPVTKQFKKEIGEDIAYLTESLINTEPTISKDAEGRTIIKERTSEEYMQLRGMIKALRGVLEMGVTDSLMEDNKKEY